MQTADWSNEIIPDQDLGVRLQAFLGWIGNYGHLPYEKQQELLWELGEIDVGVGTLVATNERVEYAISSPVTQLGEWVKRRTSQRSFGNLLLKRSRLELTDSGLLSLLLSLWFLGELVFYGINVVLFAKALEKLPVSTAYSVFAGIGFVLIAISDTWLFREHFNQNHWVGLSMILAGIIIMSRS